MSFSGFQKYLTIALIAVLFTTVSAGKKAASKGADYHSCLKLVQNIVSKTKTHHGDVKTKIASVEREFKNLPDVPHQCSELKVWA